MLFTQKSKLRSSVITKLQLTYSKAVIVHFEVIFRHLSKETKKTRS